MMIFSVMLSVVLGSGSFGTASMTVPAAPESFAWAPDTSSVTWTDNGGTHSGNLATFNSTANKPTLIYLNAYHTNITSFTGFQDLSALQQLDVHDGSLTNLDLHGLTTLTLVQCNNNYLKSINVSGCSSLATLNAYVNALTNLSLTGCSALNILYLYRNYGLGTNIAGNLDLSPCPNLTQLDCAYTSISNLDLSVCPKLTFLESTANYIPSFDVTMLTNLEHIVVNMNPIAGLDLSQNTNLLYLDYSSISTMNAGGVAVTNCPNITFYGGDDCHSVTNVDISLNPKIDHFYSQNQKLTVSSVNAILNALNSGGLSNGLVYIEGQTPVATPTGTGLLSKTNLINRGWDVKTD